MKRNILFTAMAVLLLSCHSSMLNESDNKQSVDIALEKAVPAEQKSGEGFFKMADNATDSSAASAQIFQSGQPVADPGWDKKIIKTAHVTLELDDYTAYNNAIHAKLKSYGAYMAQEQQNQTDAQIINDITIKVPVDKFDDLMNSLSGDGIKVLEKNISAEDVTGEVVDTKARMEAKKQVRDRYLDLLKQAHTMKDILEVQEEINSIQEDIESSASRVDYLVHASAYSTINLKYFQYLNGTTAQDVEPTFFSELSRAFKDGVSVISNLLLFVISIWPVIIGGIILTLYFKRWKLKKV